MTDAAFWDKIAPRYARRPVSDMDAYETTLARVKGHLSDTDRALELGCGTGSTALILTPFVASYEGTDISGGMIGIAKEKAAEAALPNLSFRQAGVGRDDHTGTDPTVVLAFNLLHLVPDVEATLGMVHDLLPKGGLFISKTPCIGEKWYYRPMVTAMRMIGKAPYVHFIRVSDLDNMIAAHGFEIIETGLYPPSTPSRFIVARKK